MLRKSLSILISFILILNLFAIVPVTSVFAGSVHTDAKPIYTVDDLIAINNDLSGDYILMNDIDMSIVSEWEPIGDDLVNINDKAATGLSERSDRQYFSGTLDGNGHFIKNFHLSMTFPRYYNSVEDSVSSAGLFAHVSGAAIHDIGFANCTIDIQSSDTGGEYTRRILSGILCASLNDADINNCTFSGESYGGLGAAVADAGIGESRINNIVNNIGGNISAGIFGSADRGLVHLSNCKNYASFNGSGITLGGRVSLDHCYNYGNLSNGAGIARRIVTDSGNELFIDSCSNFGDISIETKNEGLNFGGLIGETYSLSGDSIHLKNCVNKGNIDIRYYNEHEEDHVQNTVGGIIGYLDSYSSSEIDNLVNCGNITVTFDNCKVSKSEDIGGVIGYSCGHHNCSRLFNYGTVTTNSVSSAAIGGLVNSSAITSVSDSINYGDIIVNGAESDTIGSTTIVIGGVIRGNGELTRVGNEGNITVNGDVINVICGGVTSHFYSHTNGYPTSIMNAYNSGEITVNDSNSLESDFYRIGGISGALLGDTTDTELLTNVCCSGTISLQGNPSVIGKKDVGNIFGISPIKTSVGTSGINVLSDCYVEPSDAEKNVIINLVTKPLNKGSYVGLFDDDDTWTLDNGKYPTLKIANHSDEPQAPTDEPQAPTEETQAPKRNISDCHITLEPETVEYDGYRKEPTVVVKDGTKVLSNGVDYTLSYANNRDVGKATITIRGIGSYSGTTNAYFTIERTDNKPLLGDADSNGFIEVCDATVIQRFTALMDVANTFNEYLADVNKDGNADLLDATCIQWYLAEMKVSGNIGFVDENEPQKPTEQPATVPPATEPPATEQPATEYTVEYDNGDYVFVPSNDNLRFDTEESALYYNNSLSVYLSEDISKAEEQRLAQLCNGEVSGRIKGEINLLQIKVPPVGLSVLNGYSDTLMNEEEVLYATYDFPTFADIDSDDNPWRYDNQDERDKGNESNPQGHDWWAEAIGAYSAWKYTDAGMIENPAVVGVLDNGIDSSHEELYDSNYQSKVTILNSTISKDHGTHVTGIIAAENNQVGIRGVADKSEIIFGSVNFEDVAESLTPVYAEHIKEMVRKGVSVVNLSWGKDKPYTEQEYEKIVRGTLGYWISKEELNQVLINAGADYQSYMAYCRAICQKTALVSMMLIIQLSKSDKDVLFVEAAGNDDYNVSQTGFFRAIDEDFYRTIDERHHNIWSDMMSYEDIRDHILVVGAVGSEQKNGSYQVAPYSNWGNNVDIVAPGGDPPTWTADNSILSLLTAKDDNDEENKDNNNNGKTYGPISGTSMSAPMVTGTAALMKSLDPTLTSKEIKDILVNKTAGTAVQQNVNDKQRNNYPMLNTGRAVKYVIQEKFHKRLVDDKPFMNKTIVMFDEGEKITNAQELHDKILENSNGTFYLANDIDMSEYGDWDMLYEFDGTLYGNGYTIKNMNVQTEGYVAGMFKYMYYAKIVDVGFENVTVNNMNPYGGTAGVISAYSSSCTIENCYIANAAVGSGNTAGGFIGYASFTAFKDLYTNASVTGVCHPNDDNGVTGSFGGIAGFYRDSQKKVKNAFVNCKVESVISAGVDDDDYVGYGELYVGGIVGELAADTGYSQLSASGESEVIEAPQPIVFSSCEFSGEVSSYGGYAWDSVPWVSGGTVYKTCDAFAGGLIGNAATEYSTTSESWSGIVRIKECSVSGTVTASSMSKACTGGFFGYARVFTEEQDVYGVEIKDSHFSGTLNAYYSDGGECETAYIGGAIGYNSSRCLIDQVVIEGEMVVRSGHGLYLGSLIGTSSFPYEIREYDVSNLDRDIDSRATGVYRKVGDLVGN